MHMAPVFARVETGLIRTLRKTANGVRSWTRSLAPRRNPHLCVSVLWGQLTEFAEFAGCMRVVMLLLSRLHNTWTRTTAENF